MDGCSLSLFLSLCMYFSGTMHGSDCALKSVETCIFGVAVGIGMKENRPVLLYLAFASILVVNKPALSLSLSCAHNHTHIYRPRPAWHHTNENELRQRTLRRMRQANDVISVYFIHDPFCFSRQFVRHPLITMWQLMHEWMLFLRVDVTPLSTTFKAHREKPLHTQITFIHWMNGMRSLENTHKHTHTNTEYQQ